LLDSDLEKKESMMLIGIAWRNIWRNKKRSLVLFTAIALGLCGGVFSTGLSVGMVETMVNAAIDRYLGHAEIHTRTFKANPVINDFIPDGDRVAASLRSVNGVSGVSARTVLEGMASSTVTNTGAQIIGINPSDESTVTSNAKRLVSGEYLNERGRLPVVIGKKLSEKLDLHIRSKLVLSFAGRDGSIVYGSFRVVGIFETESTAFDGTTLFVRRSDLAALVGGAPLVHEIAIRLQNADLVPPVVASLRTSMPDLAVDSWKDLAPDMKFMAEVTDIYMLFFVGTVLFGLLFGITNTMLMSVLDRVREFGVLMAIGMKRTRVFWLVMLETAFLSLTGAAVGIVIAVIGIGITSRTGIDLSIVAEGLSSYGISSMLYPFIPTLMYFEIAVLVILTALGAAVYPGIKATRLNPASSIRTYA
jgi:ABC-type lipoprotein release transport system permease subunit